MDYINGTFMSSKLETVSQQLVRTQTEVKRMFTTWRVYLHTPPDLNWEEEGLEITPPTYDTKGGVFTCVWQQRVPFLEAADKAGAEIDAAIVAPPNPLMNGFSFYSHQEVKKAISDQVDFVMNSSVVVTIEGSGPLITRDYRSVKEEQEAVNRLKILLCGKTGQGEIHGEIVSGVAVYDNKNKRGLCGERKMPFTFSAFSDEREIRRYLCVLGRITNPAINPPRDSLIRDSGFIDDGDYTLLGERLTTGFFLDPFNSPRDPIEDVFVGIRNLSFFPGGVYLGGLIAMGKVLTINGYDIKRVSPSILAKYVHIVDDGSGQDAWDLEDILRGIKRDVPEGVYQHGIWTKVLLEGRKPLYDLAKWYFKERDRAQRSAEAIYDDPYIPPKCKRQIICQKLGLPVNPHVHIPISQLDDHYYEILSNLRELWGMPIGVSAALSDEPDYGWSTPTKQFPLIPIEGETEEGFIAFMEKLKQDKHYKHDPIDHAIFYPFVFGEEDREGVVGGRILFSKRPSLTREQIRENSWRMELQRGRWPRGIDPNKGRFLSIDHPGMGNDMISELSRDPSQPEVKEVKGDLNNDWLLQSAEQEGRDLTKNPIFLQAIMRIMDLTKKENIVLEFFYRNGKIQVVDFAAA
jgi:hypothetical protein